MRTALLSIALLAIATPASAEQWCDNARRTSIDPVALTYQVKEEAAFLKRCRLDFDEDQSCRDWNPATSITSLMNEPENRCLYDLYYGFRSWDGLDEYKLKDAMKKASLYRHSWEIEDRRWKKLNPTNQNRHDLNLMGMYSDDLMTDREFLDSLEDQ